MFQGWWMMADPVLPPMIPDDSGLVDTSIENLSLLSFNAMLMTTVLLGAFLVACDGLADPYWRRFVLMCAALSGVLVSLVGVFLKTSLGAPLMSHIWSAANNSWSDFAFFHYHGTAGAFLNLAWPLILVFTRRAWEAPEMTRFQRVFWTTAAFACGLALFLNASKAALAIGLLILPWPFSTGLRKLHFKGFFAVGVISALVLALMLLASSQLAREGAFKRMTNASDVNQSVGGRWDAYRHYVDDLPEAGWFGIGPGLFEVAYPYKSSAFRSYDAAVRKYAHEDYLQTTLEWGWVGAVWWTLLVAGGLFRGFRAYVQRERFQSRIDRHVVLAGLVGVLGTLVFALFDFPLQIASIRLDFLLMLALCWTAPNLLAPPPRDPNRLHYPIALPPATPDEEDELTVHSS